MKTHNEYTEEQKKWLSENCLKYDSYAILTNCFNTAFSSDKSKSAIQQFVTKKIGIRLDTEKNSQHFTVEQEEWLIENFGNFETYKELTEEFNRTFSRDKSVESIRDKCGKRLHLSGMKNSGKYEKCNAKEQCPIGTIRKTSNGTTYIKVKDSRLSYQSGYREPYWLPIQKKIWQDHYGEVPKGKMVIFLDGNRDNLDIKNLYCIDRKISAVMARNRWFTDSIEHTLTAIKWCELFYEMKNRKQG